MDDSTPHDLLTGYLLDALDPHEHRVFEQHLQECARCRAELAELAPVTEALGSSVAVPPPAALEDSLMASIDATVATESTQGSPDPAPTTGIEPHESGTPGQPDRRRSRKLWWALPVAAAAAFILGIGVTWNLRQPADETVVVADSQTQHVMELAAASDASFMPVDIQGANSKLVMSHKMNGAAVMADDVPMPSGGRVYQMWQVRHDGSMRSAGTFVPDANGHVAAMLHGGLKGTHAYMLTIEPGPGSAHPTMPALDEVVI